MKMLVLDYNVFRVKKWLQVVFLIFSVTQVTYTVADNEKGCHIPPYPDFGKWSFENTDLQWFPGMVVPSGTILRITCPEKYVVEGKEAVSCVGEEWHGAVGRCLRTCPPLHDTALLTFTCSKDGLYTDCSRAVENTIVTFTCPQFYEARELETRLSTICIDGQWSNKIPECSPVCGRKRLNPALAIGATEATKGEHPWQVAIYERENENLYCGGTLLDQRIVLTAAHCVTYVNGTARPESHFLVAVKKHYRQMIYPGEPALFSPVLKIYVAANYEGSSQNYFSDIAIIATKSKFVLSDTVQPICIDWSNTTEYFKKFLDPERNSYGYVTGWGYTTESGQPSEVLNELKVPAVDDDECKKRLPANFQKYKTNDKLCAGFINKSTSVCKGDSGGGLVFEYHNRHYIVGVVSTGPWSRYRTTSSCDSQQYSLYTRVSSYNRGFILNTISKIREFDKDVIPKKPEPVTDSSINQTITLTSDGCILPEHPRSGKWIVPEKPQQQFVPGQFVQSGTHLRIDCQKQHVLNGSKSVFCSDGSWTAEIGRCMKTCPSRQSTAKMTVTCYSDANEVINCTNPIDSTWAHFECAEYYEDLALAMDPVHLCMDGKWDHRAPVCSPACGLVADDSKEDALFPWHVAIYLNHRKDLICSGSLINERLILTAAHCVSDSAGNLRSKSEFIVTVGNHYRRFNDTRDKGHVQISTLHAMFTIEEYKEAVTKKAYFADVAVLVTKKPLVLTPRVQPVCLDKNIIYLHTSIEFGYVMGWGYNIDKGKAADILTKIKIPSSSIRNCSLEEPPMNYDSYVEVDKRCVGFMDNSTLMCYGDTGAGLVYKHDGRYYLGGVLGLSSTTPARIGNCSRQKSATFSETLLYLYTLIVKTEAMFRS